MNKKILMLIPFIGLLIFGIFFYRPLPEYTITEGRLPGTGSKFITIQFEQDQQKVKCSLGGGNRVVTVATMDEIEWDIYMAVYNDKYILENYSDRYDKLIKEVLKGDYKNDSYLGRFHRDKGQIEPRD